MSRQSSANAGNGGTMTRALLARSKIVILGPDLKIRA
jgi:hypothetical protein